MDDSKNVLIVACSEYTDILCQKLYKQIYQGLRYYWDVSKKNAPPGSVYQEFQRNLRLIKKWNQDIIDNEYKRVVEKCGCEYLEDLIKQVFVLYTQVLSSVPANGNFHQKIKLHVPKGDKFLHCCYKECARVFYESVWYFEDRPEVMPKIDQAKNLQKAYNLIRKCIKTTIREMLPIESLIQQGFSTDGEATPPHYIFPQPTPTTQQANTFFPPVTTTNSSSGLSVTPFQPTNPFQSASSLPSTNPFQTASPVPPSQDALQWNSSVTPTIPVFQDNSSNSVPPSDSIKTGGSLLTEESKPSSTLEQLFQDDSDDFDNRQPDDDRNGYESDKNERPRDQSRDEEDYRESNDAAKKSDTLDDTFDDSAALKELEKVIYLPRERRPAYTRPPSPTPSYTRPPSPVPSDTEDRDATEGSASLPQVPSIAQRTQDNLDLEVLPTKVANFDVAETDYENKDDSRQPRQQTLPIIENCDAQDFFDD